jgi:hypothetical protein
MSPERDGLRRRRALSLHIKSPVEDQSDARCDDGLEVRRWCTRRYHRYFCWSLTPARSTRAGLIMSKVIPRFPILAVIFTDGSPLPLTKVGSPLLPRGSSIAGLFESKAFGIQHRCCLLGVDPRRGISLSEVSLAEDPAERLRRARTDPSARTAGVVSPSGFSVAKRSGDRPLLEGLSLAPRDALVHQDFDLNTTVLSSAR